MSERRDHEVKLVTFRVADTPVGEDRSFNGRIMAGKSAIAFLNRFGGNSCIEMNLFFNELRSLRRAYESLLRMPLEVHLYQEFMIEESDGALLITEGDNSGKSFEDVLRDLIEVRRVERRKIYAAVEGGDEYIPPTSIPDVIRQALINGSREDLVDALSRYLPSTMDGEVEFLLGMNWVDAPSDD